MSLAEMLPRHRGHARRLPAGTEELRGPARGVIMLPRHLSWPGLRECDVTVGPVRRSMYGIVLSQGRRNDIARFLNAGLLREDWPQLSEVLDPGLRRWCERRFGLEPAAGPAGRA